MQDWEEGHSSYRSVVVVKRRYLNFKLKDLQICISNRFCVKLSVKGELLSMSISSIRNTLTNQSHPI